MAGMIVESSLSEQLAILAERIATHLTERTTMPVGQLYGALVKARDEAVLLEARAGARDQHIHQLIAEIDAECSHLAALRAVAREGTTQ